MGAVEGPRALRRRLRCQSVPNRLRPRSTAFRAPDSGFYARKASGLVRELSLRDSVLLNLCWISIPLGLVYITQIGGLFPGISLGLAFLLAGLIAHSAPVRVRQLRGRDAAIGRRLPVDQPLDPPVRRASS